MIETVKFKKRGLYFSWLGRKLIFRTRFFTLSLWWHAPRDWKRHK